MDYRVENDSLGEVRIPRDKYYGAQTQRSKENFNIGIEVMPPEVVKALAIVKKSVAIVNNEFGVLADDKCVVICEVCDEILAGELDGNFPLMVWQTGSGTHTNMNVNEVISNRANEKLGGVVGSKKPIHPNDDVNKSQSSNDTFPTAMHIAAVSMINECLLPNIGALRDVLHDKAEEFNDVIKVGRTHYMDALHVTVGQEFSGYASQLDHGIKAVENALTHLMEIALGGTAVGTEANTPSPRYSDRAAEVISDLTGLSFVSAPNKFEALAANDAMVEMSGALKRVSCSLMKIANDIRLMASGPRCGLGEITIPVNEPGSSIMPGKTNPTQCEALAMISVQVMGNDAAIGFAASQGNLELNVFKPVMIYNLLQSIRLLADGTKSFRERCVSGIDVNRDVIAGTLEKSLMSATLLTTKIGYDSAVEVVKKAYKDETTLKDAAMSLGLISEEDFDAIVGIFRV